MANHRPCKAAVLAEGHRNRAAKAGPGCPPWRRRRGRGACTANTAGDAAVVGFAGDWSQAVYGTVEGVQIAISDQATLTDGSTTINLFEQNMFAVRAEIEVGFRCDTTVFNKLTGAAKTGS